MSSRVFSRPLVGGRRGETGRAAADERIFQGRWAWAGLSTTGRGTLVSRKSHELPILMILVSEMTLGWWLLTSSSREARRNVFDRMSKVNARGACVLARECVSSFICRLCGGYRSEERVSLDTLGINECQMIRRMDLEYTGIL